MSDKRPVDFYGIVDALVDSGDSDLAAAAIKGRTLLGLARAALQDEFPDQSLSGETTMRLAEMMASFADEYQDLGQTLDDEPEDGDPLTPPKNVGRS